MQYVALIKLPDLVGVCGERLTQGEALLYQKSDLPFKLEW